MLLKNAKVILLSPPHIETVDLRIADGKIVARGKRLGGQENEQVLDLESRIVMPGMVCAHTHLYSSLARGMPGPKERPRNFLEILQKIWWKLDCALDEESIYHSAIVGSIEAALCGTTVLIDHHASPNAIKGSLDIIKEAMQKVGLRGVLCYEVTDRGTKRQRDLGLDENQRFIKAHQRNSLFRGLVGAHASFTLGEESMEACGDMAARTNTGVHIHIAEDMHDVVTVRRRHRIGLVDRLSKHAILRPRSVLAHCIHLTSPDFKRLRRLPCWLVHNPRSNMNNGVGHARIDLFGTRAAMGTDGFPADMFEEMKIGFFRMQEEQALNGRVKTHGNLMADLLGGGQRLASDIFGDVFGTLAPGSVADLVILDYEPPTPLTVGNLPWHMNIGMRSSMVDSVMVNGKWIVRDHCLPGTDLRDVYEKATAAAKKLWQRML